MCLCKVCFPAFSSTWVTLTVACLGRFWSSLYEKQRNIEIYCSDCSHSVPGLFCILQNTMRNSQLIYVFPEQSFERCLPLDSNSHILCLSCGGQLWVRACIIQRIKGHLTHKTHFPRQRTSSHRLCLFPIGRKCEWTKRMPATYRIVDFHITNHYKSHW